MPTSPSRAPKSSHDAFQGRTNRSPDQPNHHANPANRAESRISAPRMASSTTATGGSCFAACLMGGEATATVGWDGTVGAGGGAAVTGAGVVAVGVGAGAGAGV